MSLRHHPDYSSLVSYAAGSLPDAMSLVISCHLSICDHCKQIVADAEQLGSQLLEDLVPADVKPDARNAILGMLDEMSQQEDIPEKPETLYGDVPPPLQSMLGNELDSLHWRTMAPGMKQFIIPAADGNLRLLKIAPGTCMPVHGHTGSELTMVLKGSYSDEIGRFCTGDIADLDPEVQHQPVADTSEGCICLIATDAPLRFVSLVPRLLQPFFRL